MNVRVKICGMTNLEDALHAEACGAHAVGFIFYGPSPRCVRPETVAGIAAALHPYTVKVGVFVGETSARMNEIAGFCNLDRIQLHGGEPYELLATLDRPGYRALRLREEKDLQAARGIPDRTVLLDTFDPGLHGGTGRSFNWEWALEVGRSRSVILAGGISPENVRQAISAAQPGAVDVSSSLEAEPGRKDPAKVEALFRALAAAGQENPNRSQADVIAI